MTAIDQDQAADVAALRREIEDLKAELRARDRAAEEARRSEEWFRDLFQNAPLAYQSLAEDGRFLDVNRAFLDLFGCRREDAIGTWFGDWLVPAQRALFEKRFACFMEDGEVHDVEFDMLAPNGRRATVRVDGRIGYDAAGRFQRTHCILHDLTAARDAERARRASESRLHSIFNSSMAAIALVEHDGTVIEHNDEFARLLGVTTPLRGTSVLPRIHPEDFPRLYDTGMAVYEAGGRFELELRWLRADGKPVWVRHAATLLRDERGAPQHWLLMLMDITAQHVLRDQLQQAQKMESIGRLAGGIAHDFNNLLTAVLGYSELALRDLPESDPSHEPLVAIHEAGRRAMDLTRKLLSFARRQIVEPRVVDLDALVRGIDGLLQRLLGEDVRLVTQTGGGPAYVRIDPGHFEQVLVNLAVNARDAMPDGGTLRISARTEDRPEGDFVVLEVEDSGHGFSDEVKSRLFEPFFTTKDVGKGTGLGLATCYGIVAQCGGEIEAESIPGQGATFRVRLPRVAGAEPEPGAVHDPSSPGGSETILLVEDEPLVRRTARAVLVERGYTVLEARDAAEATILSAMHAGPIHLLLTDVVMPGMNGPDLARALSAERDGLKVLFASGYADRGIVQDGELEPGIAFIAKPFSVAALARKVRELLDSERA